MENASGEARPQPPHDPTELDPRLVGEFADEPAVLRGMVGAANDIRARRGLPPLKAPGITGTDETTKS